MNAPVIRPAFAAKIAPLNADREPTLKEALMEALMAQMLARAFGDERLCDKARDAREALYDAFARHGVDRELAGKIGDVL
jgi:hypothetical protein